MSYEQSDAFVSAYFGPRKPFVEPANICTITLECHIINNDNVYDIYIQVHIPTALSERNDLLFVCTWGRMTTSPE